MSNRVLPAIVASIFATVSALLLFVPFVAREHRRNGEFAPTTAALRFAAALSVLGVLAYTLIPLPVVVPGFCEAFAALQPQWQPFAVFNGARPRLSALLSDTAVRQFGFNILLFVPIGVLARRLVRCGSWRGVAAGAGLGFAASLAVELTQLTGLWFRYPCPYRLFDVDDLIANTTGALIGTAIAPLLRRLPGPSGVRSTVPRPVTAYRRLLGMCCDVLLLWWLGYIALRVTELTVNGTALSAAQRAWLESVALWFAPAVLLLVTTTIGGGTSLGQRAVSLRCVPVRGSSPAAVLHRWIAGLGGFACTQGVAHAMGRPGSGAALALAWCTIHAFGVTRGRDQRGISGWRGGLKVVDARIRRTRASGT